MVNKSIISQLKHVSPRAKFILFLVLDIVVSVFANWLAYTLRLEAWHIPNQNQLATYIFAAFSFIPIFYYFNIYRIFNRYTSIT
ncbi:hypothetical protein OAH90_03050, partial [Alphaproteobacteria bacterium]|nr:hypothetical protein [Alphaproteobacteria bacterium]